MKKLFNRTHVALIILTVLILTLIAPANISAMRDNRARFIGAVTLDRQNVPAGSIVTARIGQQTWSRTVYFKGTDSWYWVEIPKNSGQGGGLDGDLVYFSVNINGKIYNDPVPAVWKTASDISHPIRLKSSESPSSIKITTTGLPDGVVDTVYPQQLLAASGGTPPLTWDIISGELPAGLEFSDIGTISGIPEIPGMKTFTVKVTDNQGMEDTKELSIRIWKLGDANQDGKVNRDDVMAVVKMHLGIIPKTISADANKDGKVDMADVVAIQLLYDSD